jgi:hypothetical protein
MADELDALTQQTLDDSADHDTVTSATPPPERDSGHDQSVSLKPEASLDAAESLDALFKEATGEDAPKSSTTDKPDEDQNKSTEDDPDDTDDSGETGGIPDPAGEGDQGADKGAEGEGDGSGEGDDSGSDGEPSADGEESELDKVKLPPHTSQKAADSFNLIKQKAKEQVAAKENEIAELKTKLSEFETKATVTPEEKSELEELRKFRASVEIEKDPKFREEFTSKITENNSTIYKVLQDAGMKEEQIETIKKFGGPTKLTNWDDIYEHLSSSQKRIVDGRLNDNDRLERDQKLKLEAAKQDVDKYLEQRDVSSKTRIEQESKAIQDNANEMLQQIDWAVRQDIPKDATPEQKKKIEEQNKYIETQIDTLKQLLVDRSPANHATLAVGTIQALHFRKQLDSQKGELETLRQQNKELSTKLQKIRKSGASAHKGSAPQQRVKPVDVDPFNQSAEDALDALRSEVESNA